MQRSYGRYARRFVGCFRRGASRRTLQAVVAQWVSLAAARAEVSAGGSADKAARYRLYKEAVGYMRALGAQYDDDRKLVDRLCLWNGSSSFPSSSGTVLASGASDELAGDQQLLLHGPECAPVGHDELVHVQVHIRVQFLETRLA